MKCAVILGIAVFVIAGGPIATNDTIAERWIESVATINVSSRSSERHPLFTLAFCLHLEVAQVGISLNFLQENA